MDLRRIYKKAVISLFFVIGFFVSIISSLSADQLFTSDTFEPEEWILTYPACPQGCECLTGPDAEAKFGSGSFKSCSDKVCGLGWVGDLEVKKFCYSPISIEECIDTDGGQNYSLKGSTPACVDQCSEFSHPPRVVKECYLEEDNGKCISQIDYHDCNSTCEDGRCLDPSCNDWIQNQGEEGVDCGGPCEQSCTCETGCKCSTALDASEHFGEGGFTACSDEVCGSEWVGDIRVDKKCFRKTESYDCIDTDGGAVVDVKGNTPGCVDECLPASGPRMLKECTAIQLIDGCEEHSSVVQCEGLCENGQCVLPTCDDGIQNQGEMGVDCGGSCSWTCCNNGIQDMDEEGIDCGGSYCTECGWVTIRGRILYDNGGANYNPVRYGHFFLNLCDSHPCNTPTHDAKWITDSNGYFSLDIERKNFKSVFVRLGHEDNDDPYKFNYAVEVARNLNYCEETVWWHSRPIEISQTGNVNFGDLKIGRNTNIDFNGYWQEETDAAFCGGGEDESGTIDGGSAYFNIADAILFARQYADGKRSDDDSIGIAEVQWPVNEDTSHYNQFLEVITLTKYSGFEDGTIIHEYAHYLQDVISTADWYSGSSAHVPCTYDKDKEFAWKEGFASYFGTIVPHTYPSLSRPNITYGSIETSYCPVIGLETEATVSAVLWDLADNPSTFTDSIDEAFDTISGKETLIFKSFDDDLDNTEGVGGDAGDLCELIEEGWNCDVSGTEKDTIIPLLEHHNIVCDTTCND